MKENTDPDINGISTPCAAVKELLLWPHAVRIIAIFAVIMLHTAAVGWSLEERPLDWQICNFFNAISRFGVPVFVMVSGMFLLNPGKEYSLKKLYFFKIFRLSIAFLFWSVVYTTYTIFKRNQLGSFNFVQFMNDIIEGRQHLWFIFMICGLYVITPFLRHIVKDEKLTVYFLIVSFISVFTLNTLHLFPCLESTLSLLTRLDCVIGEGYAAYFVWGYWLSTHTLTSKQRKLIYILGILGTIATIAGNGIYGHLTKTQPTITFDNLSLNVFLTATAVFVFCRYNFTQKGPFNMSPKTIVRLGKWSFGIYLVHVAVMEWLLHFGFEPYYIHPIIYVPAATLIIFFVSLAIIFLLDKIPFARKYLI